MNNIRLLTIISSILLLISSCKKDDGSNDPIVINEPDKNSNYFLTDTSNYWVYEYFDVDTLGNERFLSRDTATSRTEIINGEEFLVFNEKGFLQREEDFYYKDSAGFIHAYGFYDSLIYKIKVNLNRVIFSATTINTVIQVDTSNPLLYTAEFMMVRDNPSEINVPAGNFTDILNTKGKFIATQGATVRYPAVRYADRIYAKGVGLVFERFFYFSLPKFIERRLVEYSVVPNS